MSKTLFLHSVVLALIFSTGVNAGEPTDAPLKVLFVGNSYTGVNDLPGMVVALAAAAGNRQIEVSRHVVGGCTFEKHVRDGRAIAKIRSATWDVVVLQEQSLGPIVERASMFQYGRRLAVEAERQGARLVFYLTWARQHIPDMQEGADPDASPEYARAMYQISGAKKSSEMEPWCQQHAVGLRGGLNDAYYTLAKQVGGSVCPVGVAWRKAMALEPPVVLHQADKSHPSRAGTYLSACVFYASLLQQSPVGLPAEFRVSDKLRIDIPTATARRLQQIAWGSVQMKPADQ